MAKIDNVYDPSALGKCVGYYDFTDTFDNVVHKDSPGQNFGFDARVLAMQCIDMDEVEKAQSGSNDRTMDLVLGVSDFDDVKQVHTKKYLLPVELKLNCVAFNLGTTELLGKDNHTRSYNLGLGFSTTSVFLFTEDVIGRATNAFGRWRRGTNAKRIKEWEVMTPQQFNSFVKFAGDFPYVPQTDMNIVEQKIYNFIVSKNVDGCADYIQGDLKKKIEAYFHVYNMPEINYVVGKLKDVMRTVVGGSSLNGFEKDYLNLAAETIYGLAN